MIRRAKTENGIVEGIEAAIPTIAVFKGIPFAAPPIGANRWRAPQPAENWEGVYRADHFAPISMQETPGLDDGLYTREWHVNPEIPMSEDCLYLNVWTPAKSETEKLPVLVWFFGGGFQAGYTAEMEFDGERLARRGIVVVTVNYRLNIFGFLAHPQLTAEQPESPTNFGHLDQQAGIKWVKRNIAAFGGDPDQITIAGQSAGGGSVMLHLTSPQSEGLFQRAIVVSGAFHHPYDTDGIKMIREMRNAEQEGVSFLNSLGVGSLEEARELDAAQLLHQYSADQRLFTSVIDGKFALGDPVERFRDGKRLHIPVMSGHTSIEFPLEVSVQDAQNALTKTIGTQAAQQYIAACGGVSDPVRFESNSRMSGIEYSVRLMFEGNARQPNSTNCYYYYFDPDIPGWDHPGPFHSSDLWFWFETLAKCWRPFEGRHYDLARLMCNYWANFVKKGDPNGDDASGTPMPHWAPYSHAAPYAIRFEQSGVSMGSVPASKPLQILLDAALHTEQEAQHG